MGPFAKSVTDAVNRLGSDEFWALYYDENIGHRHIMSNVHRHSIDSKSAYTYPFDSFLMKWATERMMPYHLNRAWWGI